MVKVYSDWWQVFVRWCCFEQGFGINDVWQINWKVLVDYVVYLCEMVRCGEFVVSIV